MLPVPGLVRPLDENTIRQKLSDLVAATVFPTLDAPTLNRLLKEARRVDIYGWLPTWDNEIEWRAGHDYDVDDIVVPTIRNGRIYIVATAGSSTATEPVWPLDAQSSVTQDGVEYLEITDYLNVWYGAWDLNSAAAQGWRIKAGLVSNRHAFGTNQGNYNPEQLFDHCMKMADYYASKKVAMIQMSSDRWDGSGRIPGAHWEDAK